MQEVKEHLLYTPTAPTTAPLPQTHTPFFKGPPAQSETGHTPGESPAMQKLQAMVGQIQGDLASIKGGKTTPVPSQADTHHPGDGELATGFHELSGFKPPARLTPSHV